MKWDNISIILATSPLILSWRNDTSFSDEPTPVKAREKTLSR